MTVEEPGRGGMGVRWKAWGPPRPANILVTDGDCAPSSLIPDRSFFFPGRPERRLSGDRRPAALVQSRR
ncbi:MULTISPECIES: hypothetical protein [Actinomadura]|uniref:Uncharacterized protein n=1 Tax=Actinomadura geliboluensis TaxID=882440 RepID=A0A5S4HAW1_9ACTN|nr:hypothetical protein [Actinomadura geliboluensis]TMR42398.1 hypothetical protein ETD96_00755 [Actinomadura geliboluensis]